MRFASSFLGPRVPLIVVQPTHLLRLESVAHLRYVCSVVGQCVRPGTFVQTNYAASALPMGLRSKLALCPDFLYRPIELHGRRASPQFAYAGHDVPD